MKKMIIALFVISVVGVASADLSTTWFNSTKAIYDVGGSGAGGPFIDGAVVQLIWSPTGITTDSAGQYAVSSTAVRGDATGLAGEFVLAVGVTKNYGFFDAFSSVYTDVDVGGTDIHTGYFFTRVFQATGAGGEFFLDTDAVDASLWVVSGSPPDPSTVYSDPALASNVLIDANASTVIPEPATFGLMGLAGLGLFMARRSALKKARRI